MTEKGRPPDDEFTALISRFSGFIYAQIQKTNPQNQGLDRDDLFQEVSLVLWKILSGEKKIKNRSSYIMRIVNSVVVDHIRTAGRQRRMFELEKNKVEVPESERELGGRGDPVEGALSYLSRNRQRAVRLFLLDLDIEEIASICRWTEAKTRNLVYRGLHDLKDVMSKKGVRE